MIDDTKARNIKAGRKYDRHSRAATSPREKGRTFVFFLTLGQGGWFSERKDIVSWNFIFAVNANRVDEFAY